jgi:hypothetical protein
MKRSASGILLVGGLFALLVLINFIFFVDTRGAEENELNGSRSSYRSSPYGTLAFYTLLEEGGHDVTRFQLPYSGLRDRPEVGALVIVAPPQYRQPNEEEMQGLTRWVTEGGLLVIIDREIELSFEQTEISTDWDEPMAGIRPLQPTLLTRGVEHVELSEYATHVVLDSPTAVFHLGNERAAVLAEATVGEGRIVLLTDPYVVANNGIPKADNAVLASNLFAGWSGGTIAFDEYHHGFGSSQGAGLMSYFSGTPLPWMLYQAGLVALLVVYSLGRRFGRPLPLRHERRTTNLEFVSGMANITRLARASDVAMQNIYSEFRKRLCRYSGMPSKCETARLAQAVARRAGLDERAIARLLTQCDQVARGRPATEKDLLNLVGQIRSIESELKL